MGWLTQCPILGNAMRHGGGVHARRVLLFVEEVFVSVVFEFFPLRFKFFEGFGT